MGFGTGDAICEIEVDGVTSTFHDNKLHEADIAKIYWYFVDVDQEVGVWGTLLEYFETVWKDTDTPVHVRRGGNWFDESGIRASSSTTAGTTQMHLRAASMRLWFERSVGTKCSWINSVFVPVRFSWTIQQAVAHADVVSAPDRPDGGC